MRDLKTFRLVNKIETTMIYDSLSTINSKLPLIFEDLKLFLYISFNGPHSRNIFPLIYLITNEQQKTFEIVNFKNSVYSACLYFGFIKRNLFYLSLEGAEFLFKSEIFTDFRQLYVNEKGEKSILYGNNILKRMVFKEPSNLKKEDFLLVFNKLNEIIAIAKSTANSQKISNIEPNKIIAINLNDKGAYLRIKQ